MNERQEQIKEEKKKEEEPDAFVKVSLDVKSLNESIPVYAEKKKRADLFNMNVSTAILNNNNSEFKEEEEDMQPLSQNMKELITLE